MSTRTQDWCIAATLRDDILSGRYRSGERLPSERDLAERFGVHRSTVREAFKRLEQLGIADIRRGGTRVSPIEEASLDILEHLLALEDPPNPELVDQTLEAMSGILAHAARLGAERGSDEQRAALLETLDEMICEDTSEDRRGELLAALGDGFVQASGNPVMRLVRHGLRSRYSNYVLPDRRRTGIGHELLVPHLERLAEAVRRRDGAAAGEAIFALTDASRAHIKTALERERGHQVAPASSPLPTQSSTRSGTRSTNDLTAFAVGEKR